MRLPACTICKAAHRKCTRNGQPCSSCIGHPWADSTQAQECQYTDPSTGEVLDVAACLADEGRHSQERPHSSMSFDPDSASRTNACGQRVPVFEPSAAHPFVTRFASDKPSDWTHRPSHYAPSECSALPSDPNSTVPSGPALVPPLMSPTDSFSHSLWAPDLTNSRPMHEGRCTKA